MPTATLPVCSSNATGLFDDLIWSSKASADTTVLSIKAYDLPQQAVERIGVRVRASAKPGTGVVVWSVKSIGEGLAPQIVKSGPGLDCERSQSSSRTAAARESSGASPARRCARAVVKRSS